MKIPITYDEAFAISPDAVADICAQKQNSTSINKMVHVRKLTWGLDWCIENSLARVVELNTVDEMVADSLKRVHLNLIGKIGRARWYSKLDKMPIQIINYYRKECESIIKERERIASLTPEQRQKMADDAISYLMGQPGFAKVVRTK